MVKPRQVALLRYGAMGASPSLKEIVGWEYNAVLTGLSFRLRDGVWTAIIKADHGNRALVAYVDVGDFARCVEVAVEFASKGWLRWTKDKYPPRIRSRM